jgi:DivIVA domain-containing protein
MTLTLEQVRATRFHLARRNGYEPSDVDDFVDKVEATFVALLEENDQLRQQTENAVAAPVPAGNIFAPVDSTSDELRADLQAQADQIEALHAQLAKAAEDMQAGEAQLQQLGRELSMRDEELVSLRAEVQTLRQADAASRAVEQIAAPPGQVENIVVTSSEQASTAVTRLLAMATDQAERLVGESKAEAQRLVSEARTEVENVINNANQRAHETLTDARTRADRIESEARVNAEAVTSEAKTKADQLTGEAQRSRAEILSKLETERDELRSKVEHLRTFESNYRTNLTTHMEKQIKALSEAKLEPDDAPAVLAEPPAESTTPRLDALLGD